LLEVYAERGLLVEVDGMGEVDAVTERVFATLGDAPNAHAG
jgi:adenylate kinase